jgi:non-lysosomal glucosylceramidase
MTRFSTQDEVEEGEGQIAIATISNPAVEVYYQTRWNPKGNGESIWQYFASDGSLLDTIDETPAKDDEQVGSALAVRFTLRPGKNPKSSVFPVVGFARYRVCWGN